MTIVSNLRFVSRRRALSFAATGLGATVLWGCSDESSANEGTQAAGAGAGGGPAFPPEALETVSCDNDGRKLSSNASGLVASDFEGAETCPVEATPSSIEGPYFYCVEQLQSDLTAGRAGTPLRFGFRVIDAATCRGVEGAVVDVWHCDAAGNYAGYITDPDVSVSAFAHLEPTQPDEVYCRGAQRADSQGIVGFTSIVPGWYSGRAVHIHFKVQLGNLGVVTHQLLLPQDAVDRAHQNAAYSDAKRTGEKLSAEEDAIQSRFTVSEKNGVLLALSTISVRVA